MKVPASNMTCGRASDHSFTAVQRKQEGGMRPVAIYVRAYSLQHSCLVPAATSVPWGLRVAAAAAHLQAAGHTKRGCMAWCQQTAGLVSTRVSCWFGVLMCLSACQSSVVACGCRAAVWDEQRVPVMNTSAMPALCKLAWAVCLTLPSCWCRHEYPQWRPQDLSRVFPTLEESGLELLRDMLQYDPARRISVSPDSHTGMQWCS